MRRDVTCGVISCLYFMLCLFAALFLRAQPTHTCHRCHPPPHTCSTSCFPVSSAPHRPPTSHATSFAPAPAQASIARTQVSPPWGRGRGGDARGRAMAAVKVLTPLAARELAPMAARSRLTRCAPSWSTASHRPRASPATRWRRPRRCEGWRRTARPSP